MNSSNKRILACWLVVFVLLLLSYPTTVNGETWPVTVPGDPSATINKTDTAEGVTFTIEILSTNVPHGVYGVGMVFAITTESGPQKAFQVYYQEWQPEYGFYYEAYGNPNGWCGLSGNPVPLDQMDGFSGVGDRLTKTFTISVPWSALGGCGHPYYYAIQFRTNNRGYYPSSLGSPNIWCADVSLYALQDLPACPKCTKTGFIRDGMDLTAALIDPGDLTGSKIDAVGCNIGVYFSPTGGGGTLTNVEVYGANYFGIVNDGATVNVQSSNVHNIGEDPFNGAQHGVGIYFYNDGSGTIDGNTVSQYQKGGIVVNVNSNAVVTNNVVTGLGPVDFIAQNGIQFGFGSTGVVRGNTISGNYYTGTVCAITPNSPQCPPGMIYVSTGLLLYSVDPSTIKRGQNDIANNQRPQLVIPA